MTKGEVFILKREIAQFNCSTHGRRCPGKKTVDLDWYQTAGGGWPYREHYLNQICPDFKIVEPKKSLFNTVINFFLGLLLMYGIYLLFQFIYVYLPSMFPTSNTERSEPIEPDEYSSWHFR